MAQLVGLLDVGQEVLHPQHHLLRLVIFLAAKITKPCFQTEYTRAFGEYQGFEKVWNQASTQGDRPCPPLRLAALALHGF